MKYWKYENNSELLYYVKNPSIYFENLVEWKYKIAETLFEKFLMATVRNIRLFYSITFILTHAHVTVVQ